MWKPEHRLAADRRGLRSCRMVNRSAHDPARPARRAQTVGERARGAERDILRAVDRLPMEGAAQGSAAEAHGARLCCLNGGSSNERSHGFVVTVVWLATSNASS
jgi:hypothetical protein